MDTAQNISNPNRFNRAVSFARSNQKIFYPLFLLIVVLLGSMIVKDIFRSNVRTASVVGVGKLKVKPEKAIISFSVVQESTDQQDVIQKGELVFGTILAQVNTYNPLLIEKSAYQILPKAQNAAISGKIQTSTTYQYVNAAKITVSDLTTVEKIISSLYSNGASAVSQVRFVPKDEEEMDREVRKLAVKNAKDKANDIARASGSWVGRVVTIQEGGSTGQTGSSVTGSAGTTTTTNLPGEIELQAMVTVVYELY